MNTDWIQDRLEEKNKKTSNWIKNGPTNLTDTSPKKVDTWHISIWKDEAHHMSSVKYKLKIQ